MTTARSALAGLIAMQIDCILFREPKKESNVEIKNTAESQTLKRLPYKEGS